MANWEQFIEQVKKSNDIVAVIGSYIDVSTRGHTHWARCPFHGEKTPSFAIDSRGFYKCFGCGESGDVITFVQKYESCTFMEAVEMLANRAKIPMPERASDKQDGDIAAKKKVKDKQLALIRETAMYYRRNYLASEGVAKRYIANRGFTEETAKAFGIGYSPNMNGLVQHLEQKGYSLEMARELGVLSNSKGKYFDAMSGRLIIPIINVNSDVIAFGGRALDERTAQYGKYKNTSDSPQFNKTNNVFGINVVKKSKQNSNLPYIIMVEGYMDVIAMYQAGYPQCVASMGTSLTQRQAKTIARLSTKIYICYDGDKAGIKATIRGLDILQAENIDVFVVSIPDGLDPDEYIAKFGKDKFDKLFAVALPLVDYKLKYLHDFYNLDDVVSRNANLPKYVKGAINLLKQLDDEQQQQYARVVSRSSGYSPEWILSRLFASDDAQLPNLNSYSAVDKAIFTLTSYLLSSDKLALPDYKISTHIAPLQAIIDYIYERKQNGEMPRVDMIYTLSPNCDSEFYNNILPKTNELSETDFTYYNECVIMVKRNQLMQQRQALISEMANVELESEKGKQLSQSIESITNKINMLQA